MYENYEKIRNERGFKNADVARATGIDPSTFSDWKSGKSKPKIDKIEKIADFLCVSVAEIKGNSEDESNKRNTKDAKTILDYYTSPEATKMLLEIMQSPGRKALFKAVANMDETTVRQCAAFIERITSNDNNPNN